MWAASLKKLRKGSHCGWRIIWGKAELSQMDTRPSGLGVSSLTGHSALRILRNPALNFKCIHLTASSTSPLGWEKSTSNVKSPSPKSLPPQRLSITRNIPTIQWDCSGYGIFFTSLWFHFQIQKQVLMALLWKSTTRKSPGGQVVRTLCFHCREHGFDPWSVRELRSHLPCSMAKNKIITLIPGCESFKKNKNLP